MKKSIGLYADTRNFKTTLPQTKHLNFFMQTNPQGYANGGQVRAGIPQSNMKVTSGFLPMALGYDSGGESYSFSEIYRAIVKVTADLLGKSEDDPQVQEEAEKIAQTEEGQELAKKLLQQARQTDVETEVKLQEDALNVPTQTFDGSTTPSSRQPQFNLPNELPTEVVPEVNNQSVIDDGGIKAIPQISPEQIKRDEQEQGGLGIEELKKFGKQPETTIESENKVEPETESELPFYLRPLDINKDGKITMDDYNAAMEQGLPKRILDAILRFLGQIPQEDNKQDDGGITTIKPEGPNVDVETEIKESEKESEDDKKIIKPKLKIKPEPDNKIIKPKLKIKPEPDNKISTGTGRGEGALEYARRKTDLSKKDAKDVSTDLANLTGNEGKKEIPEWALPLASAGFAMMASKSPNFLQALGEAGQAGIATLQEQRGKQAEKAEKDADIEYKKALSKYYLGEGRQSTGTGKTLVQNGVIGTIKDGVFTPVTDSRTGLPLQQKIGREEAIKILTDANPNFGMLERDEQEKQITSVINLYNNTDALVNKDLKVDEGGGFDLGGFFKDSIRIIFE